MKPEEFSAKTQEIVANITDQGKVTTVLAELIEDYNKVAVEIATATTTATQLKEDNEKLRKANLDLFLQIGTPATNTNNTNTNTGKENNTPTYESLFDEKGNIK